VRWIQELEAERSRVEADWCRRIADQFEADAGTV
jgi:hypothetical protein